MNPYEDLDATAYWRSAVANTSPLALKGIYQKKWVIGPDEKIAAAGSCFAQHISRYLRVNNFNVFDVEPPPPGLPKGKRRRFGYSLYSARYGNIYTVRQLSQLAQEAINAFTPGEVVWTKYGKYYDALRPSVEPDGLDFESEVLHQRQYHLARVRELFQSMDVFIFTLGLTEAWVHKRSGTVFPTAPGAIAGSFDPEQYEFKNFGFEEIRFDFIRFQNIVRELRGNKPPVKYILTVSPVPLTATASNKHVLQATAYSKATLRAVAGLLSENQDFVDYFPSYEIVTNQAARGVFYSSNLRTVTAEGVSVVMNSFFEAHKPLAETDLATADLHDQTDIHAVEDKQSVGDSDEVCEDALLEAFGR